MKKDLVTEIISGLLILLFSYTALSKLLNPAQFVYSLSQSPVLEYMATFVAIALPIIEIVVVLLLAFRRTQLAGLYFSLVLLVSFTTYIIYMVLFQPKLPCSCGGVLKDLTWKEHILFNLSFILLNTLGILKEKKLAVHSAKRVT